MISTGMLILAMVSIAFSFHRAEERSDDRLAYPWGKHPPIKEVIPDQAGDCAPDCVGDTILREHDKKKDFWNTLICI